MAFCSSRMVFVAASYFACCSLKAISCGPTSAGILLSSLMFAKNACSWKYSFAVDPVALVIVAAGAFHRLRQKHRAYRVGHIGDDAVTTADQIARVVVVRIVGRKPVAILAFLSLGDSSSPASCSLMNWSYGLSCVEAR